MNKATNRRALTVYLVICLLYVSVAFRIPEKLSMKRIGGNPTASSHGMNVQESVEPERAERPIGKTIEKKTASPSSAIATAPRGSRAPAATSVGTSLTTDARSASESGSAPVSAVKGSSVVEPRLFISIPITCYAIKEGWLEREALIFSKKDGQNTLWLKPLDILKQQDESGLKHLVTLIGKNRIKEFLKKEDVDIRGELSPEDIMLGRGYVIEKKKLLSLYDRFVPEECNDLFPLVVGQGGVVKDKEGFRIVSSAEAARMHTEKEGEEWRMPNLNGLPIKLAIDNLAVHTARIKVYGSGLVVDQHPKPFERLRGETECAIYGRLAFE
ncbi:MAG TPA: hypothetical protein VKF36_24145 [Syntrophorhabdales bacterium]|nr:hypothetical protein [Syntrophorhabdales bacterium]